MSFTVGLLNLLTRFIAPKKVDAAARALALADVPTRPVKMVIVLRNDLNMRKGKLVAQGGHAAASWLSHRVTRQEVGVNVPPLTDAQKAWVAGTFTKIALQATSAEHLELLATQAEAAGLHVARIVDAGHTEFHGVPTLTCIGIGPDWSDKIDEVTGGLKLW